MFQSLAYHLIGAKQVGGGDTLAIGRVGYHNTLLLGLGEVLEVTLLNGDITGQTCSLYIQTSRVDCLDVDIVSVNMMMELSFV